MRLSWRHRKIFYGWWIVAACFLIAMYTGGAIFFGFTALFEPIANEFGWSYAQISFAASLRGLEIGLLAPLMGLLVDRWGPRRLLFGGAIIMGLGLILLSRVSSIGMFYAAFILIGIGTSTSAATVVMAAVVNWFRRRMATAAGIASSGFAAGGLLIPLVTIIIDTFGWRMAVVSIGLGIWVIGLPLSVLVRHKPEQYGYLPDGDTYSSAPVDEQLTSVRKAEMNVTAKQALKSRAFWHITLASMCQRVLLGAVLTHVMPYLSSIGIARSTSSLVASALPLASASGRLGFGLVGDRFDKRRVGAVGFALLSVGILLFGYLADAGIWLVVPFLLLFGTGWGGTNTMRVALLGEHFGRSRFGTLFGFAIGVAMLGQIAGAPLAGWVFDNWHSYQGIWFILTGLAMVGLMVIATTPQVDNKIIHADHD